MNTIGFIGVGNMGRGMCENIINNGYKMTVFDIDIEKLAYFKGRANLVKDVKEVFSSSDVIFLSLPNSDVIESVAEKYFKFGINGKIVIDVSTSFPDSTKRLYGEFKNRGGSYIDAPILGGPDDTAAGTAPCLISGDKEIIDEVLPIISCYANKIDYLGNSGNASTVKLAMNFTGLMYAAVLAQMFPLMEKVGINTENLFKIMNEGLFQNWIFDFYGEKIVTKDYHMDFSLEYAIKDLSYMKLLFDKYNVPGFLLDGALDLMRIGLKDGRGKRDTSEIAAVMRDFLGLSTG